MSIAISQTAIFPEAAVRATPSPGRNESPPAADSWIEALAKLIPGEVIIAFTAALQLPGVNDELSAHLTILVVFTALCPVVLWASARRASTAAHWLQYVVRSVAFVLYGFGSDKVLMDWLDRLEWIPGVGALVVAVLAALVLSPPGAQRPPPATIAARGNAPSGHAAGDPPPETIAARGNSTDGHAVGDPPP